MAAGAFPVADSAGWQLQAEAANFEAADATPVRGLSGDWARYTPRAGRNAALQQAGLTLTATRARWELAATVRSELVVNGSRGAFDVVHAYKQRTAPADGSRFTADAQAQGVVWAGLRGARTWTLRPGTAHGVQASAAISVLSVRRVRLTGVAGSVAYTSAAGYAFDAQTREQDSRDSVAGFGEPGATGSGYSADLGLLWQPTASSFVNLSLVDAASRLRVKRVFTEETTLSSATRSVDADGYLDYRPLAVGSYSSRDVTLRLARKLSLSAGAGVGSNGATAGLRWERVSGVSLPALWVALPVHSGPLSGCSVQADVETRFRAVGLGLAGRYGALMLRRSHAEVGRANALGWQASLRWQF